MLLFLKIILYMIYNVWDSNFFICFWVFLFKLNVWRYLFMEVFFGKYIFYVKCFCYVKDLKVEINILYIFDYIIVS